MNKFTYGTLEISRLKTFGWENALIGMRFPKNTDNKYTSIIGYKPECGDVPNLSEVDESLLLRLVAAGRDHRKVLRMIHVQMAIKMPISWWIQFDTYKVATVANSRSRMHKFGTSLLTKKDFYVENWTPAMEEILNGINSRLNEYTRLFAEKDNEASQLEAKKIWREALDMLPMSYIQERMWDGNYETLASMFRVRWADKLKGEWHFFLNTLLDNAPYFSRIVEACNINGASKTTEEFDGKK